MKQPNPYACLPTCVAMLLETKGVSYRPEQIMAEIGHDGTQIILGNPRQFTIYELVDWLWPKGYTLPEIVLHPLFMADVSGSELPGDHLECVELYPPEINQKRIDSYLATTSGILLGRESFDRTHAMAWIDGRVHDPRTEKICLFTEAMPLEVYYPFIQIKSEAK